jgi:ubiquinone/menaquinone biosynthesis C-methylase UbiE
MFMMETPDLRHQRIFNLIAPIYSQLNGFVKRHFREAIETVNSIVELEGKSVLDVGTGTGAWASLFVEKGASQVQGLDFAEKMIDVASKRYSSSIMFSLADAQNLPEYEDNSFDIVTASFVLHGVKKDKRGKILTEMKRITKDMVVIHDYCCHSGPVVRFLERLEKSDYINFKRNFYKELSDFFPYVHKELVSSGRAIYFGSRSPITD